MIKYIKTIFKKSKKSELIHLDKVIFRNNEKGIFINVSDRQPFFKIEGYWGVYESLSSYNKDLKHFKFKKLDILSKIS